ncbi:hypothetical protein San01_22700 [Streptomyces angustmyceticus]|uniref:Uncharacterized protein n=1 Tax=Streptomyces angustmyceticus TaxID=285578 RepID=A0A5J4L6L3_9ACTN|nr:hypothetical protein San01_22700 [Streptomyces angustmyceticus]
MASAEAASRDDSATARREDTAEPAAYEGSTVLSMCIAAPLQADGCTAPPMAGGTGRRPLLRQPAPGSPGIHLVSAAAAYGAGVYGSAAYGPAAYGPVAAGPAAAAREHPATRTGPPSHAVAHPRGRKPRTSAEALLRAVRKDLPHRLGVPLEVARGPPFAARRCGTVNSSRDCAAARRECV